MANTFQRLVWVSKELLRAELIGNAAFGTDLGQGWPFPLWEGEGMPQPLCHSPCSYSWAWSYLIFGEKVSNSLWLFWKLLCLSFWREIWKLWVPAVPSPREHWRFWSAFGMCLGHVKKALHHELSQNICLRFFWPSIITSDYSITAQCIKVVVEIGCKCRIKKVVLKLYKIVDRHPNCESVCYDLLSQVGCYPAWVMFRSSDEVTWWRGAEPETFFGIFTADPHSRVGGSFAW